MEDTIKKYKSRDDYPLLLKAKHIQEIMDIGRRQTYDFLSELEINTRKGKTSPPFHFKRLGNQIKVSRDSFFNWIEGKNEAGV